MNDWPRPLCMVAQGGSLYVLDASDGVSLWRVDPNTLTAQSVP